MKYDYLIVGSGLFGATFAHEVTKKGKTCVVIEKRNHIGGNIYTENVDGINIHKYGPHIFHTSNKQLWDYVNKFATFNNFVNRPKVVYKDKMYSFPINLMTLYQLWDVRTPNQAIKKLEDSKVPISNPSNLEDWCLSQIGYELYETFIKGYTTKQWGTDPKNLPTSIIKRLPIRTDFNDSYYFDTYQGIPIGGYTQIITGMLKGIPVYTGVDYLNNRSEWDAKAQKVVYTGAIDEYFDYCEGELAYRTCDFETERLENKDFQGVAQVNYTDQIIPWTRIIEHKHYEFGQQDHTIITREYPSTWKRGALAMYPVNDLTNTTIYKKYRDRADQLPNVLFGGRLAEYKYYDMHQVIGAGIFQAQKALLAY